MKRIDSKNLPQIGCILEETTLISYSRLMLSPRLTSLLLFQSDSSMGLGFRDEQGQLYEIHSRNACWSEDRNRRLKDEIREMYRAILEDDCSPTAKKLADECELAMYGYKERPKELTALLEKTEAMAGPDDYYGFYGNSGSAIWLWKAACKELHILGDQKVELLQVLAKTEELFYRPMLIAVCLGISCVISRMIIHEGISYFSRREMNIKEGSIGLDPYAPLLNSGWDFNIGELVLPSSLTQLPLIKGFVDKMTVPAAVSSINLADLWVTCGGHFDPVYYAVRSLRLSSTIEIEVSDEEDEYEGELPLLEPVSHWEEIVLYGTQPVPDLAPWYKANVFNCDLIIRYPSVWDIGKNETFTGRVVAYARTQKPRYGRMSGMDSEWFDWGEEEYQELAARIVPYKPGEY